MHISHSIWLQAAGRWTWVASHQVEVKVQYSGRKGWNWPRESRKNSKECRASAAYVLNRTTIDFGSTTIEFGRMMNDCDRTTIDIGRTTNDRDRTRFCQNTTMNVVSFGVPYTLTWPPVFSTNILLPLVACLTKQVQTTSASGVKVAVT